MVLFDTAIFTKPDANGVVWFGVEPSNGLKELNLRFENCFHLFAKLKIDVSELVRMIGNCCTNQNLVPCEDFP